MFDAIGALFTFKPGSVSEPTMYLGADITKWQIEDSDDPQKVKWAMTSHNYTRKAIAEVKRELYKVDKALPRKVTTPMSNGY